MPQHLTPNMIKALEVLDARPTDEQAMTVGEIGQQLVIRYTKGAYRGQPKIFGKGSAAAAIMRALQRRGLARWTLTERFGETVAAYEITAAGCAKLAEVRDALVG